jgi:L-iditol 2-dehydrogenase
MRTAVYYSNADIRIEERPLPEIGPGELLMRIEASGICGSDTMEWYRVPKAPTILGHEVAGVVEAVGAGVSAFAVGNRIVTTHHVPCNTCRYCQTDRHSVCDTLRTTSFDPGGFCEFVRLPAINVEHGTFILPDNVTFEQATFVEPLACIIRGQRMANVQQGDTVVVLGSGISGILMIQLARARGAGLILATDVSKPKREAARRFGADVALDARENVLDALLEATAGRLAERVIVCTGAPSAFEQSLPLVDRGGSILFFAPLLPGEILPLPVNDMWRQGVSIVHSYAGPPAEMKEGLELIAAHKIDVGSMVTHRLGLADTGRGFQLMDTATDALKVMIEPQK